MMPAGKVEPDMYSKAEGIEAFVYEDKIEEADAGGLSGPDMLLPLAEYANCLF